MEVVQMAVILQTTNKSDAQASRLIYMTHPRY